MKQVLLPLCILFVVAFNVIASEEREAGDVIPGELIVQFTPDFGFMDLYARPHKDAYYVLDKCISSSMNIWLVTYDHDQITPDRALKEFRGFVGVEVAQHNHVVKNRATVPNDDDFGELWGLRNTGQNSGIAGADIDAILAWDSTTGGYTALGDTIVVAVIDGRFDTGHIDINYFHNRFEIPWDSIDNDSNGYVDDYLGWNFTDDNPVVHTTQIWNDHATHVSGTIGAIGDNDTGVVGVNWNVQILPLAAPSNLGNEAVVVEAYAYIRDLRKRYNESGGTDGAFIVSTNSSFGVDFANPDDYPIWCSMYDSMGMVGVISAGATANLAIDIDVNGDVPTACASDFLLSVTNTTQSDVRNPGAAWGKNEIDLGAPGTGIFSTVPGDNYDYSTGTSMATPHVAGAVALLYSAACAGLIGEYYINPDSIALFIRQCIIDGAEPNSSLQNVTVSGGRLNAYQSILELDNFNCNQCNFQVVSNVQQISCYGDNDASIALSSGTTNLSFAWSNNLTTPTITNLAVGSYRVTVTDSMGCKQIRTFQIEEPDSIEIITLSSTPDYGNGDGSISIAGAGGSSVLQYSLDGSQYQLLGFFDNLTNGSYTVYVKDSNDCLKTVTIDVNDNTPPTGLDAAEMITSLQIAPVPTSNEIRIDFDLQETSSLTFSICDQVGHHVFEQEFSNVESGSNRIKIDMEFFSSGIYYLNIRRDQHALITKKVVKL